ncbi:MAG: DUF1573 domain-containing protein [Planctomycetota bacterium]|nr:DUF1573 domain-containing protein [Planctomycetota bacterium]
MRPQSKHSHRFTIKNPTDSSWRLVSTLSGCTCTIAKTSRDSIPPRGEMDIVVEYTAGYWTADERRTVTLRFDEPGPIVVLAVEGKIRAPLTFTPRELVIRGSDETILNVHNFSEHDWRDLHVTSDREWLTVEKVEPLRLANGRPTTEPRQTWRVLLRANREGLEPRSHIARVQCKPDGFEGQESAVVTLWIESLLRVNPPTLFFGEVAVDRPVERDLQVSGPGPLGFKHDLGDQLSVTEGARGEVTVRLSPDGSSSAISGALTISSGEFETTVTIRGLVREATE